MFSLASASRLPDLIPRRARELMRGRLFGPEDWLDRYGYQPSEAQLLRAGSFPWGIEVLEAACPFHPGRQIFETHVAFFGVSSVSEVGLTVLALDDLERRFARTVLFSRRHVANLRAVSHVRLPDRWYLMPMDPVTTPLPYPLTKPDFAAFVAGRGYELPLAVEEVAKRVLFRDLDVCQLGRPQLTGFTRSSQRMNSILVASVVPAVVGFWPNPPGSTYANALLASRLVP